MSKFVICFFGIPRALNHTASSINLNIMQPLSEFDPLVLGHFFDQKRIENERSKESGEIDFEALRLLPFDSIYKELPDKFLDDTFFSKVKYYGDEFRNGFQSIRNLLHQLKSLSEVSKIAIGLGAEKVLFVRPDIMYHDSFSCVGNLIRNTESHCFLPRWQHWSGGYNYRFALCTGENAIQAYGCRYDKVLDYLKEQNTPLHPEKFLKYCLKKEKNVAVRFIDIRGSRVRLDGQMVQEDFMDFRLRKILNALNKIKRETWPKS